MSDDRADSGIRSPAAEYDLETATLADEKLAKCPFDFYSTLRAHQPVRQDPALGFTWIAKRTDVLESAKKPVPFSSRSDLQIRSQFRPKAQQLWDAAEMETQQTVLNTDPPEHSDLRRAALALFPPKRVKEMKPYLTTIVEELLTDFVDESEIDFVQRFASILPATVIADEYGLPRADRTRFRTWTDSFLAMQDPTISEDKEAELAQHVIDMRDYVVDQLHKSADHPEGGALHKIATMTHSDGSEFTWLERAWTAILVFIGGNETTVNTLSSAMYQLAGDPELQERIRADRSLVPKFIEEVLRFQPSVQVLVRKVTDNVEVAGTTIPKGSDVMLSITSANRDETFWEEPDKFWIDRPNVQKHVAFGFGSHACVGLHLAREELVTAINGLLDRLGNIRLQDPDAPPPYIPSAFYRAISSLPIIFEPIN